MWFSIQHSSRLRTHSGISESSPARLAVWLPHGLQDAGCFVINIKGPPLRARTEQDHCAQLGDSSRAQRPHRGPAPRGRGRPSSWGLCPGPVSLKIEGVLEPQRETQPLLGRAQDPAWTARPEGRACLGWTGWQVSWATLSGF